MVFSPGQGDADPLELSRNLERSVQRLSQLSDAMDKNLRSLGGAHRFGPCEDQKSDEHQDARPKELRTPGSGLQPDFVVRSRAPRQITQAPSCFARFTDCRTAHTDGADTA